MGRQRLRQSSVENEFMFHGLTPFIFPTQDLTTTTSSAVLCQCIAHSSLALPQQSSFVLLEFKSKKRTIPRRQNSQPCKRGNFRSVPLFVNEVPVSENRVMQKSKSGLVMVISMTKLSRSSLVKVTLLFLPWHLYDCREGD